MRNLGEPRLVLLKAGYFALEKVPVLAFEIIRLSWTVQHKMTTEIVFPLPSKALFVTE